MMKSIEKLRALAEHIYTNNMQIIDHLDAIGRRPKWLDSWHEAFDVACDEIEREIAERYMLLPVDADGVPIRVGDELVLQYDAKEKPSEVESITFDGEDWYFTSSDGFFNAVGWHHTKPRTLEDVLAEYRLEADRLFCDPSIGGEDRADALESLDARYAAEIRELMEVDE